MLGFRLSDDQEKIRSHARQFARNEVLPVAWACDSRNQTPRALLRKAFDAGLMSTNIPEASGGRGLGLLEACLVTEELAAACPGIATSIFDNSLGLEPLILCANAALKERYLEQIANEFKLICFATSEPTMGSDVSGIRCRATAQDDGYLLSGTKYWITNGGLADYISVFATVDPESAHKGICAFLVERDWAGVHIGRPIPKLGQRGSNTTAIHFEAVRVPKENVMAAPGEGFALAMRTFARTRPTIGAFAVGAARSAMEYALAYARKRKAFGSQIVNFQAIQFKLAEMYQKVETARLLVWKAAWEADMGLDPNIAASVSKLYATEAAYEVVDEALQILGGYGYTQFFPVEKLLRDTRLFRIYEGTSEIQRMILAGFMLNQYESVMPPPEKVPMHGAASQGPVDDTARAWKCRMCGYLHHGDEPPERCPYCFFPAGAFQEID
jgi:acyl-CoA dehydrogenase